jgi:VWFA-related protein
LDGGARAHAAAHGGAGAAAPLIRTEARIVLVDAAVTNKQGEATRDLTAKDFRIEEDGKDQKILEAALENTGTAERSQKHYFVLFFGTSTLSAATVQTMVREAAKFVQGAASPDRYFAVVQFSGGVRIAQNLTADVARILAALNTVQGSSMPSGPGVNPGGPGRASVGLPGGALTGNAGASAFSFTNMLGALRSVSGSLEPVRGRKALVLFSGGNRGENDVNDALPSTVDALNSANVAVYAVGSSGLVGKNRAPARQPGTVFASRAPATGSVISSFQPRGLPGLRPDSGGTQPVGSEVRNNDMSGTNAGEKAANQSILRALADGTGGFMITAANDLAAELNRVAQEQDAYYLLTYTPAVESPEGSCHNLKVSVRRGGLTLRSRKGYCTTRPPAFLSASQPGGGLEGRALGTEKGSFSVKMEAPYFYSQPGTARVNLVMEVDPMGFQFAKEKGRLHASLDVAGIAARKDGSEAARFSDKVNFDFPDQKGVDAFLSAPYRYTNQFDIAPGDYTLHVAFAQGEKNFGKAAIPLAVEAWNGQAFSASGLALSHNAHPATDIAAALDPSLLEGPQTLISAGTQVTPTGNSTFRVGERGFYYFEAYEPRLGNAPPAIMVRTRVLDGAGGKQISDSGQLNAASFVKPGNGTVPIGLVLPSAGLPAGTYRLEVSVNDGSKPEPVMRTVDFEVK